MIRFLIVGSGYRAEFYGRVAHQYPTQFQALFLCRSEEKVALMKARTQIDGTTSLQEAKAFLPDFVVISIQKQGIATEAIRWAQEGYPVLTETPVGASLPELSKLWDLHLAGKKIVTCEQYHRYPILTAGLRELQKGTIGTPYFAYLSLCHDYHGFSMIRRMLQLDPSEPYHMYIGTSSHPIVETDSRLEAITDGRIATAIQDTAFVTFASGKEAIYQFSGKQYHSYLRSRHLTVQGERGEWHDTTVYCLGEDGLPTRRHLLPTVEEKYRFFDTAALRDLRKTWTDEIRMDNIQDEYAIATILYDMGDYLNGGKTPYPMEEALSDAAFWLLLADAREKPWRETSPKPLLMPWMKP